MENAPESNGKAIGEVLRHVLPPALGERRRQFIERYAAAVREVESRATGVYEEMVRCEMDYLVGNGWSKEKAYLPAMNNVAVRKQELVGELIAEVGRLQEVLRRGVRRLLEELEDSGS